MKSSVKLAKSLNLVAFKTPCRNAHIPFIFKLLIYPVFRAVNTESELERRKFLSERQKIQNLYISSSKSMNIDRFLAFNVSFDQNQAFYNNAKSNILFSFVNKNKVETLLKFLEKYNFLESKQAFFEFIRICIDESRFIQAKKLLNLAKLKGWFCNDYFELKKSIESLYFGKKANSSKLCFDDLL